MEKLDQSVVDSIRILAQSVQDINLRSCIELSCPTRLTRNQFLILNLLRTNDGFPIGEIAAILDISSPAASKNIDRLEKLGFVHRRLRKTDRRVHDVVLLPAGGAVVDRFVAITAERQLRMLNSFTNEEKEQLLGFLRRIVSLTLAGEERTDAICLQCYCRSGEDCIIREQTGDCPRERRH